MIRGMNAWYLACGMILKVVEPLGGKTWMVEVDDRGRPSRVIPALLLTSVPALWFCEERPSHGPQLQML